MSLLIGYIIPFILYVTGFGLMDLSFWKELAIGSLFVIGTLFSQHKEEK